VQVELRSLGAGDEALLWDYLYLALFVPPGGVSFPREVIRDPAIARYVAGWGRMGDAGLLATDRAGGRDVGAAWLRIWPVGERGYGFVDHATPELSMAVRPECRGRGVGSRLLRSLLEGAERRYPAVSLSVSNANPAIRLYERCGFEVVVVAGDSTVMRRRSPRYER